MMSPQEEIAALTRRCEWDAILSEVRIDDPEFMMKIYYDLNPTYSVGGAFCMYRNLGRSGTIALDGEYGEAVRKLDPSDTKKALKLARTIAEDRHLHGWIRLNLLDNLCSYLRIEWRLTPSASHESLKTREGC